MRITNNMIMGNTKTNINSAKTLVDKYNTQMTTQKKIDKASDDPFIESWISSVVLPYARRIL